MSKDFSNMMSSFWTSIMDKLNSSADRKMIISDVMRDICRYFNFGCSFIYLVDANRQATLFSAHRAYLDFEHLDHTIDLGERLDAKSYQELLECKNVNYDRLKIKTTLDEHMAEIFRAQALLLLPLTDKSGELMAFIGMADRRGESREGDQDLNFAHYILVVIGNYLRILLSAAKAEKMKNVLTTVINDTGVDVFVLDYYTDAILYMNASLRKRLDLSDEEIGNNPWQAFFGKEKAPEGFVKKENLVTKTGEFSGPKSWNMQVKDGSWRRFISTAFYWVDGRLAQSVSSIDITERVKREEQIRYYSEYDALTGLRNRHKLLLDCDDGIETLLKEKRKGYIGFCDLNHFKVINDTYGHDVGDELLRQIGAYFNENKETKDRVYRYAGDEFVLLFLDKDQAEVEKIIEQVKEDMKEPFLLGSQELVVSASLGVTCFPDDARTTSDLIHKADLRMYESKHRRRQEEQS
ncbi:diguanylate cyclase (GGDEF)-like protein [Lachnospiraceae bacterium PF1-22]